MLIKNQQQLFLFRILLVMLAILTLVLTAAWYITSSNLLWLIEDKVAGLPQSNSSTLSEQERPLSNERRVNFETTENAGTSIEERTKKSEEALIQLGDWDFYPGDFSQHKIIGNSLPGSWRAYASTSPWNTKISKTAYTYPDSNIIIGVMSKEASNIRLIKHYNPPIWVVNSENMPKQKIKSKKIFDTWDKDRDGWTDVDVPIDQSMWAEPTLDGHIIIVDPFKMIAWEMSKFRWIETIDGLVPSSTTFNIWDLKGKGHARPLEGRRWHLRGGRGSGLAVLAGLIRPEELEAGEIRHALLLVFSKNRKGQGDKEVFISPPAVRSDGQYEGDQYPIQGMRFQLNPKLTEVDFDAWGLTKDAKTIARALQEYGMILGDDGGAMSLAIQMLAPSKKEHLKAWEERSAGLYRSVSKIPTNEFRAIFTAFPLEE